MVVPLQRRLSVFLFFFNDPATTEIYTLSLHDALPISSILCMRSAARFPNSMTSEIELPYFRSRSEEHTSELQSRRDLVCRLLLEKKKAIGSDALSQEVFKAPSVLNYYPPTGPAPGHGI